jgi:hypothetical protein
MQQTDKLLTSMIRKMDELNGCDITEVFKVKGLFYKMKQDDKYKLSYVSSADEISRFCFIKASDCSEFVSEFQEEVTRLKFII